MICSRLCDKLKNMFLFSGTPVYRIRYNSSDETSNEVITNTTTEILTDLEPNTTYTVLVEGLTPNNTVEVISQPKTFTTSKETRKDRFAKKKKL